MEFQRVSLAGLWCGERNNQTELTTAWMTSEIAIPFHFPPRPPQRCPKSKNPEIRLYRLLYGRWYFKAKRKNNNILLCSVSGGQEKAKYTTLIIVCPGRTFSPVRDLWISSNSASFSPRKFHSTSGLLFRYARTRTIPSDYLCKVMIDLPCTSRFIRNYAP